ncbi:Xaa-Pro peptidase family protein [Halanaerobium sp. ST460_2HS_T2]|uniref:M24 family metallopeptidase n=1 Tax=Halanaerobium sp. ST460_2HS_T2 TaxID=2183914 RepID=UPI000DF1B6BD|nr:Xaa-Pro peptidase family protein [Halanaerobium sp. ST460_2HS_T2]RCW61164.1 Xaa-Pro aminopeptidase [Halanaerobium sp. ST460_2HS_T2]
MEKRINKLREKMKEKDIEAFLVTKKENVRYLSQFTGTAGKLLITETDSVFITDFRYLDQAAEQTDGCVIEEISSNFIEGFAELIKRKKINNLSFESQDLNFKTYQKLKNKLEVESLNPVESVVEDLRMIKDLNEVDKIKKAVEIADRAFDFLLEFIEVGKSEKEIALELEFFMKKNGGEANAFDFIVASGKRGALPHGVASKKIIEKGDLITIDFGTVFQGYHSDITRTVAVGEPDSELKEIYQLVLRAQQKVISKISSGMDCIEADKIARDLIKEAGYGDNFGHGLGHGIGLEIHENPRLSYTSDGILKPGMVVTDEPGIYISGLGGVRIEDDLLITEEGCEVLNSAPKELIVL